MSDCGDYNGVVTRRKLTQPERVTEQLMEPAKWITVAALCILLAEGFVLSVFPQQFKAMLAEAEPRWLQAMGLVETVVATGLIAGILLG